MREIKFRAWDETNKIMVYGVNINDGRPVRPGYQWFNAENVILHSEPQQYTGVKDRNGKEIYEGDIVKTDLGKGVVVFDSGAFLIRNLDDDEYYGFDDFFVLYKVGCYLVEVIGNIYENPELLEG